MGAARTGRAEVKFLTWTDDNLLRQVVYEGLREDKPAADQMHYREEFVVVGWTDPEGSRPWLGALLLAGYHGNSLHVFRSLIV